MSKPTRFSQEMIDDFLARGDWVRTTFTDFAEQNAQLYPDQEAFVDSQNRLTWKEVKLISDRLALAFLERGISRGAVIVAILPNVCENAVLRLALEKAGLVGLFIPLTARRTEIDRILEIAGATACVLLRQYRGIDYFNILEESPFRKNLKHIFIFKSDGIKGTVSFDEVFKKPVDREFSEDRLNERKLAFFEVSLIQLTSGSTGIPKLCEWPIAASVLFGKTFIHRAGIRPGDVIGAFAPLSGGPGVMAWMTGPQIPVPTIFMEHFETEEALRLIEREKITVGCTVPTQVIRLSAHPRLHQYDLCSLRVIRVGGAALSGAAAEEIEEKLGCAILPAAGCSECMSIGHTSLEDPPSVRLGTVGKPWLYNEVRIVDPQGKPVPHGEIGEITVRGACTASGFYNDMETTMEVWGALGREGWCRTRDLGKMDPEGNIVMVGRIKEIIIRGGQNIYPREIEILLSTHPNVMEVAIVPVSDSEFGERVCACVILRAGGRLSFDEMVAFLKAKEIAPYKIPERLEIVEKFPMIVDGGKVDKRALGQMLMEKS